MADTRARIVVGVSPRDRSDAHLHYALREAARRDATVLAVTVCADEDAAAAERGLEQRVRRAVAATGVRGRTQVAVLAGPVTGVLLTLGREADLLVLGLHQPRPVPEGAGG